MKPTLVIMAAGMGSRYGGLKQLDPVGPHGETLLEYAVYDAIRAGFGKIVFVIRTDFETEFKDQVGSKFKDKIETAYAFQSLEDLPEGFSIPQGRTKPWGTGQAILASREAVNESFAVQNADDFYGADAYQLMADALSGMPESESCMVGYLLKNTLSPNGSVSRGICDAADGYLTGIVERTCIEKHDDGIIRYHESGQVSDMSGTATCSMNFWGFSPSFFRSLEDKFIAFLHEKGHELRSEWYIPSIVDGMINNGDTRVRMLRSGGHWFGVTYPEDKPTVAAALKAMHDAGEYPPVLWPQPR